MFEEAPEPVVDLFHHTGFVLAHELAVLADVHRGDDRWVLLAVAQCSPVEQARLVLFDIDDPALLIVVEHAGSRQPVENILQPVQFHVAAVEGNPLQLEGEGEKLEDFLGFLALLDQGLGGIQGRYAHPPVHAGDGVDAEAVVLEHVAADRLHVLEGEALSQHFGKILHQSRVEHGPILAEPRSFCQPAP